MNVADLASKLVGEGVVVVAIVGIVAMALAFLKRRDQ